ncbi:MAG: SDR family NAD(P)-dependent oxidoreductase [Bacteroidia bacterium]
MNYAVFGGTKGIGKGIAEQLISQGHSVWVLSRNQVDLAGATWLYFDAEGQGDIEGLPDHLNGMVYAPGSINLKPFRGLKEQDFQKDFAVSVLGAVRALQACTAALKSAGQASVVLYSTVAVAQGMPFHASVAAAKGAVEGLVRSLAAEWAPAIRVNAVAPSLVRTPLAERLLNTPEKEEQSAKRHALARVGEVSDIAAVSCFLLSPESGWVSGQVWSVDGGMSRLRA